MYKYSLYAIVDRRNKFEVVDLIGAVNGKEALKRFMRKKALTPSLYRIEKAGGAWIILNDYGSRISAEMVCKVSGQLIDSVQFRDSQTVITGVIGERIYRCPEQYAKRSYLLEYLLHTFEEMPEKHRPVIGQCYL